jgi:hypothetical protein
MGELAPDKNVLEVRGMLVAGEIGEAEMLELHELICHGRGIIGKILVPKLFSCGVLSLPEPQLNEVEVEMRNRRILL